MADIQPIDVFASAGERNTDGLTLANGFPAAQKPARQWFNTLFYDITSKINALVTAVNAIVNAPKAEPIKVGDIYITTINHANAAAVAAHHSYGTWERTGEGTHLSLAGTSDGVTLVGGVVSGSHTHTITVDQIPEHYHDNGIGLDDSTPDTSLTAFGSSALPTETDYSVVSDAPNGTTTPKTSSVGGGEPMPIRPRTTTYYGWVRLT